MFMCQNFKFPMWPLGPIVGIKLIAGLLAVLGVIFSIVMLIDCLKRKPQDFASPLTRNGEYDKLVWAIAIIGSLWLYFLGAIIYYFVVKKSNQSKQEQQ